jgi:hypothetical protein
LEWNVGYAGFIIREAEIINVPLLFVAAFSAVLTELVTFFWHFARQ